MKRFFAALLLLGTGFVSAQDGAKTSPLGVAPGPTNATVTEKLYPVTRSDVYCSGFMTKQPVSKTNFVAGGLNTPYETRFADGDYIFLKGTSTQPGELVSIIREVRNPDDFEMYPGTKVLLKEAGQPYFDIGYARVVELRGESTVAQVEFVCQPILPGDIVLPFVERPMITARPTSTMDRFPADKPTLQGRVAMTQHFDQLASAGSKLYIDIGLEKGVKCGDYFRVTRTYSPKANDKADTEAFSDVVVDDTQKTSPRVPKSDRARVLPRKLLGEIIILNVTPTSATGMVTFGLEEIHVGDMVELEPPQEASSGTGSN